jgi:ABC-type transport system involved in multi-copper enzyme maturation permease subunit
MSDLLSGVRTILGLELRQRVRGVAWYVLIGVFVVIVGLVTVVVWGVSTAFSTNGDPDSGATIYSTVIYFVLLLGTLVTPALSGNAINGDREAGTLATTQITLITAWQLVLGKFLAAWISALAFLVASTPFIFVASLAGGLALDTFSISIVVLALELGIVAAIGVGLSGLLNRPLFSVVVTYLAVAALSLGSLIVFGLGGLAVQSQVTYTSTSGISYDDETGLATACTQPSIDTYPAPRFDYFWGVLVTNPYVVLADAVPTYYDQYGQPNDLFGGIKYVTRQAQIAPELDVNFDECSPGYNDFEQQPTPEEVINSTVPAWFVGLVIHIVLAAAALVGAWARLRTPARRLGKGSRIA